MVADLKKLPRIIGDDSHLVPPPSSSCVERQGFAEAAPVGLVYPSWLNCQEHFSGKMEKSRGRRIGVTPIPAGRGESIPSEKPSPLGRGVNYGLTLPPLNGSISEPMCVETEEECHGV